MKNGATTYFCNTMHGFYHECAVIAAQGEVNKEKSEIQAAPE